MRSSGNPQRTLFLAFSILLLAGCPAQEDCQNGADDNGDGNIDCDDPACSAFPSCVPENCANQSDDDGDLLVDCDDDDCLQDPLCASCGNAIVDVDEECDDGNNTNGDGCEADCTLTPPPACGDGTLDVGEACDDGNNTNGDGCRANCSIELCGDTIVDSGEQCDDGNNQNSDGCEVDCTLTPPPACGDGTVDAGEQCDDGNNSNGDGCRADCLGLEVCGDSLLDTGEECDDGNNQNGDGCEADCTLTPQAICGDTIVDSGEECDDGNFLPGDTCDPICQNPPVEDTFLSDDVEFLFDLANYCDQMTTRHAVVHEVDKQDKNLRWRCGDITALDPSLYGQEYCEYAAISDGLTINSGAQIGANGFSCLFTAVFNDEPSLDAQLVQALALPENLGATVNSSVVRMGRSVNSRGAATGLINGCSTMPGSTNEVRQTACYQAFKEAEELGDLNRAAQLESICRGQSLLDDAVFAQAEALGATIPNIGDPGFEKHREIRACVATQRGGGAFFRNSDTNICGRAFRANNECGCDFNNVPGSVNGFTFAIWFTPENDTIPSECRLAQVGGQDFPHLMICDVPAQEIPEIQASQLYQNDLKGFCNDRFGKNLGILAPLSALQVPGSCNTSSEFCQDFFQ